MGAVSGLYTDASDSLGTLVFGHGAGADMRHASMQAIAEAFAAVGISTLRFNFPFKERGASRVDSKQVSSTTIASALAFAQREYPGPFYLGGHSFGGRMATHAVVDLGLEVRGLILCSFPLHPAAKPAVKRADHLDAIKAPVLFLSGTRDALAEPELLTGVARRIGATLCWLETGDHSYKVLKRTRQRSDDIFSELAGYARDFVQRQAHSE